MAPPIGFKHKEESKRRISAKLKGIRKPPGFRIGSKLSEETKRKIGRANAVALKGRKNPILAEFCRNQVGAKNPAWNGGSSVTTYYKWTKDMATQRALAIERDTGKCQICGEPGKAVHHIDYNRNNNKLTNLVLLCGKCHSKTNHKRSEWVKYFTTNDR